MDTTTKLAIPVKLLLLDVDGVLTDGKLYFSEQGDEIKAFNTLDGLGIKLLQQSGVKVGIVTGRNTQLVARRADNLGINILLQGREDKHTATQEIAAQLNLDLTEIAYLGDDLPDLPAIEAVGLGMTVNNGHRIVKERADWCSEKDGGNGAVREACDFIMNAQGNLQAMIEPWLT